MTPIWFGLLGFTVELILAGASALAVTHQTPTAADSNEGYSNRDNTMAARASLGSNWRRP
jgi:hypothetical protein